MLPMGLGTEKGVGVLLPWTAASWSVCLTLAVAGCVLWTSGQDVAEPVRNITWPQGSLD